MAIASGSSKPSKLRRFTFAGIALMAVLAAVLAFGQARALSDDDWMVLASAGPTDWRTSAGEGSWQTLESNKRVPDSAQIRTGSTGRAVVARGLDRIEVHPSSTVVVTARNSGNGTMEILSLIHI